MHAILWDDGLLEVTTNGDDLIKEWLEVGNLGEARALLAKEYGNLGRQMELEQGDSRDPLKTSVVTE